LDTSDVVSIFLRGAIGRRGRKRARRAINFLTGNRGFLTASTLLGAAGVAWGIYDSMQSTPAAAPSSPNTAAPLAPPLPSAATTATAATDAPAVPDDVLRIVRLAVSAARADGTLSAEERVLILEHAGQAGLGSDVERELDSPRPLAEIVSGITDAQRRHDLYIFAFAIVRADETVTGAERIYLAQLAHQLQLDAGTVAALEQQAAASIDSTPESQPENRP
jgi:uncharacterized membrane protein YebE (DUF533 family)